MCLWPSMYCPKMVRVSRDLVNTLTGGGGSSVHVPIHVMSRDGQSILGYSDRGVHAVCLWPSMYCPGMVRVSQDLGIL